MSFHRCTIASPSVSFLTDFIWRNEQPRRRNDDDDDDGSDDSSDTAEEWERHEAMTDEPEVAFDRMDRMDTEQRLFEEEIEKPWEKGGSGLVFYTDEVYWDDVRGEFEDRTADGWDVDAEEAKELRRKISRGVRQCVFSLSLSR